MFEVIVPVINNDTTKENVTDNVTNERHLKILASIHSNKQITVDELAAELMVSKRTVLRDLHDLRQNKIVIRIGNNKTGHWELVNH